MSSQLLSEKNWEALRNNPYPGRGIVIGRNKEGDTIIIYWIMGRSENSRNRVMRCDTETGRVFTEAADPSKVQDPSLIIYNAMREYPIDPQGCGYVVSNGDQTDTVFDDHPSTLRLEESLRSRIYEPDAPNYTPRITGVCVHAAKLQRIEFSVLRKSPWSAGCQRLNFFYPDVQPGYGLCVTTYTDNGDPLPSWQGEPMLVPILRLEIRDIAKDFWGHLNSEHRVSLVAKRVRQLGGSAVHIINARKPVE